MIKELHIKYCETNNKFDMSINGFNKGKFYTLQGALSQIFREHFKERGL